LDQALHLFHRERHPETMGSDEVREFLTDLAANQNVAAFTQNQAFSALLGTLNLFNPGQLLLEHFLIKKASREVAGGVHA
jgi:Phage integrase, N-terminal SAM-like domain